MMVTFHTSMILDNSGKGVYMSKIQNIQNKIIAAVLLLCLITSGILYDNVRVQAASKIQLSRNYVLTTKGGTVQLDIIGTAKKPVWTSSNPKIAKVTNSGKVTAIKSGAVTIMATIEKKNYNCKVYIGDYWIDNFNFDDYKSNIINMNKGNDCGVDFAFEADGEYLDVPFNDIKITAEKKGVIELDYKTSVKNGTKILDEVHITGVNDGKTNLSFTIGKITKIMKITIGTGTGKLDPADAIKQRNYIGYEENEIVTLKKVAEIIDQNNLNSSSLSVEEKISAIQKYFNNTRKSNLDSEKEGAIADILFNGHGKNGIEDYAYTQTFGFFCECLDIPYKFCHGGAYLPGNRGFDIFYWNRVEINGTWYYIDTYLNTCYNVTDYGLSEKLWADHDLWDEKNFEDYFFTGNADIRYHLLLSNSEYDDIGYWNVD